jgi:hypothetical protein
MAALEQEAVAERSITFAHLILNQVVVRTI